MSITTPARPRTPRASTHPPATVRVACLLVLLTSVLGCVRTHRAPSAPDPTPTPTARPEPAPRATTSEPPPRVMLRGARVMTAAGVVYPAGDVLVEGTRIAAVGSELEAPPDARVVDLTGKVLTPGLIDTHSHIGVYAAPGLSAHADGNEATAPVTAEVWAADSVWPQDPQLGRARAGGVTTMQILPGSANLIGGRSVVIKPYPGLRSLEDARMVEAPTGLKMACGENPKRVYGDKGGPSTRMGNVAGYRKAFQEAVEYRRRWERYRDQVARWEAKEHAQSESDASEDDDEPDELQLPPERPERDEGLETLMGVLEGKILVHMHCYRADEMSLMMDLARGFGFRIRSFHHAVEAYKIADRLAARDVAASVWADWWGFKAEAYDAIRENAALLSAGGVRAIIHSDSPVGIQRLNQEAAKALFAGRRMGLSVSDDEALRWITANPAWALGIDTEVGTIEPGKRADLVVWGGDPFSVYTKAERVFIEGQVVFDAAWGDRQPRSDFEVGLRDADLRRPLPPATHPPQATSTPKESR